MKTVIVAVMKKSKRSSSQSMRLHRRVYLGLIVFLGIFKFSSDASAYRPFVSTDAAVSVPNKTEVELGFFNFSHAEQDMSMLQASG